MPSTTYDTTASMAVRDIAARTDAAGADVTDYTGEEDRFAHILLAGGIIRPDNGWQVVPQGGTMTILVGSGTARVDYAVVEGTVAGQGNYIVRLDDTQVAITLGGSDGTNDRIDEVYLVVRDDPYDATGRGLPQIAVRQGDPGDGAPGPDGAWTAWLLLATVTVRAGATEVADGDVDDERVQATFVHGIPAGTINMTGRSTAPPGWLLCDGQAVSRTEFARLFDAIGTTYGPGDGATTFNVPDLRGRFPIGVGTRGADTYARGDTGGSARHTLSTAELPAHDHGAAGSHTHTASTGNQSSSHTHSGTTGNDSHAHGTGNAGNHNHGAYEYMSSRSGNDYYAFQPTAVDLSQVGDGGGTHLRTSPWLTQTTGAHNHGVTSESHNHGFSTGNQSTSHSHSVSVNGTSNHTHPSVGGGSAHENRPPYVAVNFKIKT